MTIDKVTLPGQLMTSQLTELVSLYVSVCNPLQSTVKGIHVLLLCSGQALLLLNTKAIFKAMIWLTYKPIKP